MVLMGKINKIYTNEYGKTISMVLSKQKGKVTLYLILVLYYCYFYVKIK